MFMMCINKNTLTHAQDALDDTTLSSFMNALASGCCVPLKLKVPAWRDNRMHYKVLDEITYPFQNFNGATVEVLE